VKKAQDFKAGNPVKGGTIYLTAADESGMMVSFIQSNYMGFGSGCVEPAFGISLQNRGHGFSLKDGSPNQVAPGKRPFHTIIPAFLTKDGAPTFKKAGLLVPIAAKDGPHYAAAADMAGPGTYQLTYIVSPPSARGMMRRTDKADGVPEWFKPITASWTFNYP
jgi:hypothetical protein